MVGGDDENAACFKRESNRDAAVLWIYSKLLEPTPIVYWQHVHVLFRQSIASHSPKYCAAFFEIAVVSLSELFGVNPSNIMWRTWVAPECCANLSPAASQRNTVWQRRKPRRWKPMAPLHNRTFLHTAEADRLSCLGLDGPGRRQKRAVPGPPAAYCPSAAVEVCAGAASERARIAQLVPAAEIH